MIVYGAFSWLLQEVVVPELGERAEAALACVRDDPTSITNECQSFP